MAHDTRIILALGSNNNQKANIENAFSMLKELFGHELFFSEYVWTEPIGIDSDKFLNCIAVTHATHNFVQTTRALKNIEHKLGTSKGLKEQGIVNMDIDILKFGDTICHKDDWNRKYIQDLMKSISAFCEI